MEKIYSTGSTGTIGRYLSPKVEPLGIRLETDFSPSLSYKIDSSSTLIHLAAIVGHGSGTLSDAAASINVTSTIKLAKSAIRLDAKKFIFISSSHVYGRSNEIWDELEEKKPITPYGIQKALAEDEITQLFEGTNTSLVILRVFSVLGWDMNPKTLGGRIERIYKGRSGEMVPFSDDIRDFMTPRTTAKAIEYISNSEVPSGIYNLCSTKPRTVKQAGEELGKSIGLSIPNSYQPGVSDIPAILGTNTKLKDLLPELHLGWEFETQL